MIKNMVLSIQKIIQKLWGIKIYVKRPWLFLLIFDIAMFVVGMFATNYVDIGDADPSWVNSLHRNGFLSMYHEMSRDHILVNVDYPPMYVTWLFLTIPRFLFGMHYTNPICQAFFKLFPFLFTVISQIFLYRKTDGDTAIKWTLLSGFIINSFVWGQRDVAYGFFILLFIYGIAKEKIFLPVMSIVLACLLKPQGIFLIFPLLMYLVWERKHSVKNKILCFLSGCVTGYIGFLPFTIAEKDFLLPFRYYLWVSSKRPIFTEAPNLYFLLRWVKVPEDFRFVGYIILLSIVILSIYILTKKKDIYLAIFTYIFCIYMFSFGQNERMESATVAFAFAISYIAKYEQKKYGTLCYLSNFALMLTTAGNIIAFNYPENFTFCDIAFATNVASLVTNAIICTYLFNFTWRKQKCLDTEVNQLTEKAITMQKAL